MPRAHPRAAAGTADLPAVELPFRTFIDGRVGTKGSLRVFGPGQVVEHVDQGWRDRMTSTLMRQLGAAASAHGLVPTWSPAAGPVAVLALFLLDRDSAKWEEPIRAHDGDVDKMSRVVGDVLQATGVVLNDSRIQLIAGLKRWAEPNSRPGMLLLLTRPERVEVLHDGESFFGTTIH